MNFMPASNYILDHGLHRCPIHLTCILEISNLNRNRSDSFASVTSNRFLVQFVVFIVHLLGLKNRCNICFLEHLKVVCMSGMVFQSYYEVRRC